MKCSEISSPLIGCNRLSLHPALWHVVIQHLVGLNEVFLHRRHLGHDFLAVKFGCLCLPFPLSFFFVLSTLEQTNKKLRDFSWEKEKSNLEEKGQMIAAVYVHLSVNLLLNAARSHPDRSQ